MVARLSLPVLLEAPWSKARYRTWLRCGVMMHTRTQGRRVGWIGGTRVKAPSARPREELSAGGGLASNAHAVACYRKCGFIEEGREREAAFVGGAWQDDLIMGILDREFVSR
ncbi:hypothetical protein ASF53_11720 [Methylobacterium sp. Leaf123]|nr:hypothetical protein ASF53_11720 [Methylobacterium sp. Leaf123]